MTDFKNDEPKAQKDQSFKEQILAELEEANRLRQQREEELRQQALLEKKAAQEKAEKEMQALGKLQAEAIQRKKEKLEAEAQEALKVNKLDIQSQQPELDDVLDNINQAFTPKQEVPEVEEEEEKPNLSDTMMATLKNGSLESQLVRATEHNQQEDLDDLTTLEDDVDEETEPETDLSIPLADSSEETKEVADANVENKTSSEDNKQGKRQKTDGLAKRIALTLMTLILIALVGTGFFGYRYVSSAVGALDSSSTDYITVQIPEGSGNKYIGQILEKAGVIKSATVFNYYTKFKNYSNFQSGYYNLQASMDLDEICQLLQKGGTAEPEEPALGKILVTEGYTIKQIASAIETNSAADDKDDSSTPFTSEDFLAVVQDEDFINEMVAKYPNLLGNLPSADEATYRLEGYLFPATYNYYEETTVKDLVEQMISTMDSYLSDYYDTISASGYNVNEILTLASLVEKEGSTDEDRRNIASVFYNRLNSGMALQSNIAILYAQGTLGEETTLAEDASVDTSIDSPYNDYTNTGLMPGPVDSPSLSAIEATISPASTDYYYFVADVNTGNVYYAETYEEHEANVEKYVNSQISE